MSGYSFSSEALHLMGLGIGIPIGIVMLKCGWVDCEGWDLFSVYSPHGPKRVARTSRRQQSDAAERNSQIAESKQQRERLERSISEAIQSGNTTLATALFEKHRQDLQNGKLLPNDVLVSLSNLMQKEKHWTDVVPLLVELLLRLPSEQAIAVRLKLAQILVQADERPQQALAVLKKLPSSANDAQRQRAGQITQIAKKQIAEGTIEIDVFDW